MRAQGGYCLHGAGAEATAKTQGKVVLFLTCYGNRNRPEIDEDLVAMRWQNAQLNTSLARAQAARFGAQIGMPLHVGH